MCNPHGLNEQEVRDLLDNPADFQQLQQNVQMFTDILPELLIQDALFLMGLADGQPAILP